MRKSILVMLSGLAAAAAWSAGAYATEVARYLPAAIVCSVAGKQHFAYLDVIEADGTARYITHAGSFAEIGVDGKVTRPGHLAVGDCADKTLTELREAGQTRDFDRPD